MVWEIDGALYDIEIICAGNYHRALTTGWCLGHTRNAWLRQMVKYIWESLFSDSLLSVKEPFPSFSIPSQVPEGCFQQLHGRGAGEVHGQAPAVPGQSAPGAAHPHGRRAAHGRAGPQRHLPAAARGGRLCWARRHPWTPAWGYQPGHASQRVKPDWVVSPSAQHKRES